MLCERKVVFESTLAVSALKKVASDSRKGGTNEMSGSTRENGRFLGSIRPSKAAMAATTMRTSQSKA